MDRKGREDALVENHETQSGTHVPELVERLARMEPDELARLLAQVTDRQRQRARSYGAGRDDEAKASGYTLEMGAGDGFSWRVLSPDELAVRELARTSRDASIIVRVALSDHMAFKDAALSLDECEPDVDAARLLIDAHDRGEAESWLIACLLGHVRHGAGCARLIEILGRADRSSGSHVAQGLVMIAGTDAEPDLARAIDTHDDEEVRAAVALALANLGTPSALAFLFAAPARGRLEGRTLGRVLARAHVEPEVMIAALRSDDRETKRWPTVTIAKRLAWRDRDPYARELAVCLASTELRAALGAVLDEPGNVVWHTHATAIRAWLESG